MADRVYRIAIVGASSLVGKELSDALSDSPLGTSSFSLFDEEAAAGQMASAGEEISFLQKITANSFDGIDLVFFAGAPETTRKYWRNAQKASSHIVDLSGALEGDPEIVLRAPWLTELQAAALSPTVPSLDLGTTLVQPADPAATMLALIASCLDARFGLKSLSATLLIPASQFGAPAMDELHQQTIKLLSFQSLPRELYDTQVAFNIIAKVGEDAKVNLEQFESRVLTHYEAITASHLPPLWLQVLHAPVFHGYIASIFIELGTAASVAEVSDALSGSHTEVISQNSDYPSNLNVTGKDGVLLSVRPAKSSLAANDPEHSTSFQLYAGADNLRLTAAGATACGMELLRLRPLGKVH